MRSNGGESRNPGKPDPTEGRGTPSEASRYSQRSFEGYAQDKITMEKQDNPLIPKRNAL